MVAVPRFLPERAFPPYTYVPGQAPHPIRDPAGHMHGEKTTPVELCVDDWWNCTEYLWGIDLFNHGYYWEAHEAWEGLWHAADRKGAFGDFLKGLIKLAAAGVKSREGSESGRRRHLRRAIELLDSVRGCVGGRLMGLDLNVLSIDVAASASDLKAAMPDRVPPIVFSFHLLPEQPQ